MGDLINSELTTHNLFVEQRFADGSWEPDLPNTVGSILLAGARRSRWAIYACHLPDEIDLERLPAAARVPENLDLLISSGRAYPPALALAIHRVERQFSDGDPSRQQFSDALAAALRRILDAQRLDGYLLARSLTEDPGYRSAGEYVWLVRCREQPAGVYTVVWVSDDFQLYQAPAEAFAIDAADIARLQDAVADGS